MRTFFFVIIEDEGRLINYNGRTHSHKAKSAKVWTLDWLQNQPLAAVTFAQAFGYLSHWRCCLGPWAASSHSIPPVDLSGCSAAGAVAVSGLRASTPSKSCFMVSRRRHSGPLRCGTAFERYRRRWEGSQGPTNGQCPRSLSCSFVNCFDITAQCETCFHLRKVHLTESSST